MYTYATFRRFTPDTIHHVSVVSTCAEEGEEGTHRVPYTCHASLLGL